MEYITVKSKILYMKLLYISGVPSCPSTVTNDPCTVICGRL